MELNYFDKLITRLLYLDFTEKARREARGPSSYYFLLVDSALISGLSPQDWCIIGTAALVFFSAFFLKCYMNSMKAKKLSPPPVDRLTTVAKDKSNISEVNPPSIKDKSETVNSTTQTAELSHLNHTEENIIKHEVSCGSSRTTGKSEVLYSHTSKSVSTLQKTYTRKHVIPKNTSLASARKPVDEDKSLQVSTSPNISKTQRKKHGRTQEKDDTLEPAEIASRSVSQGSINTISLERNYISRSSDSFLCQPKRGVDEEDRRKNKRRSRTRPSKVRNGQGSLCHEPRKSIRSLEISEYPDYEQSGRETSSQNTPRKRRSYQEFGRILAARDESDFNLKKPRPPKLYTPAEENSKSFTSEGSSILDQTFSGENNRSYVRRLGQSWCELGGSQLLCSPRNAPSKSESTPDANSLDSSSHLSSTRKSLLLTGTDRSNHDGGDTYNISDKNVPDTGVVSLDNIIKDKILHRTYTGKSYIEKGVEGVGGVRNPLNVPAVHIANIEHKNVNRIQFKNPFTSTALRRQSPNQEEDKTRKVSFAVDSARPKENSTAEVTNARNEKMVAVRRIYNSIPVTHRQEKMRCVKMVQNYGRLQSSKDPVKPCDKGRNFTPRKHEGNEERTSQGFHPKYKILSGHTTIEERGRETNIAQSSFISELNEICAAQVKRSAILNRKKLDDDDDAHDTKYSEISSIVYTEAGGELKQMRPYSPRLRVSEITTHFDSGSEEAEPPSFRPPDQTSHVIRLSNGTQRETAHKDQIRNAEDFHEPNQTLKQKVITAHQLMREREERPTRKAAVDQRKFNHQCSEKRSLEPYNQARDPHVPDRVDVQKETLNRMKKQMKSRIETIDFQMPRKTGPVVGEGQRFGQRSDNMICRISGPNTTVTKTSLQQFLNQRESVSRGNEMDNEQAQRQDWENSRRCQQFRHGNSRALNNRQRSLLRRKKINLIKYNEVGTKHKVSSNNNSSPEIEDPSTECNDNEADLVDPDEHPIGITPIPLLLSQIRDSQDSLPMSNNFRIKAHSITLTSDDDVHNMITKQTEFSETRECINGANGPGGFLNKIQALLEKNAVPPDQNRFFSKTFNGYNVIAIRKRATETQEKHSPLHEYVNNSTDGRNNRLQIMPPSSGDTGTKPIALLATDTASDPATGSNTTPESTHRPGMKTSLELEKNLLHIRGRPNERFPSSRIPIRIGHDQDKNGIGKVNDFEEQKTDTPSSKSVNDTQKEEQSREEPSTERTFNTVGFKISKENGNLTGRTDQIPSETSFPCVEYGSRQENVSSLDKPSILSKGRIKTTAGLVEKTENTSGNENTSSEPSKASRSIYTSTSSILFNRANSDSFSEKTMTKTFSLENRTRSDTESRDDKTFCKKSAGVRKSLASSLVQNHSPTTSAGNRRSQMPLLAMLCRTLSYNEAKSVEEKLANGTFPGGGDGSRSENTYTVSQPSRRPIRVRFEQETDKFYEKSEEQRKDSTQLRANDDSPLLKSSGSSFPRQTRILGINQGTKRVTLPTVNTGEENGKKISSQKFCRRHIIEASKIKEKLEDLSEETESTSGDSPSKSTNEESSRSSKSGEREVKTFTSRDVTQESNDLTGTSSDGSKQDGSSSHHNGASSSTVSSGVVKGRSLKKQLDVRGGTLITETCMSSTTSTTDRSLNNKHTATISESSISQKCTSTTRSSLPLNLNESKDSKCRDNASRNAVDRKRILKEAKRLEKKKCKDKKSNDFFDSTNGMCSLPKKRSFLSNLKHSFKCKSFFERAVSLKLKKAEKQNSETNSSVASAREKPECGRSQTPVSSSDTRRSKNKRYRMNTVAFTNKMKSKSAIADKDNDSKVEALEGRTKQPGIQTKGEKLIKVDGHKSIESAGTNGTEGQARDKEHNTSKFNFRRLAKRTTRSTRMKLSKTSRSLMKKKTATDNAENNRQLLSVSRLSDNSNTTSSKLDKKMENFKIDRFIPSTEICKPTNVYTISRHNNKTEIIQGEADTFTARQNSKSGTCLPQVAKTNLNRTYDIIDQDGRFRSVENPQHSFEASESGVVVWQQPGTDRDNYGQAERGVSGHDMGRVPNQIKGTETHRIDQHLPNQTAKDTRGEDCTDVKHGERENIKESNDKHIQGQNEESIQCKEASDTHEVNGSPESHTSCDRIETTRDPAVERVMVQATTSGATASPGVRLWCNLGCMSSSEHTDPNRLMSSGTNNTLESPVEESISISISNSSRTKFALLRHSTTKYDIHSDSNGGADEDKEDYCNPREDMNIDASYASFKKSKSKSVLSMESPDDLYGERGKLEISEGTEKVDHIGIMHTELCKKKYIDKLNNTVGWHRSHKVVSSENLYKNDDELDQHPDKARLDFWKRNFNASHMKHLFYNQNVEQNRGVWTKQNSESNLAFPNEFAFERNDQDLGCEFRENKLERGHSVNEMLLLGRNNEDKIDSRKQPLTSLDATVQFNGKQAGLSGCVDADGVLLTRSVDTIQHEPHDEQSAERHQMKQNEATLKHGDGQLEDQDNISVEHPLSSKTDTVGIVEKKTSRESIFPVQTMHKESDACNDDCIGDVATHIRQEKITTVLKMSEGNENVPQQWEGTINGIRNEQIVCAIKNVQEHVYENKEILNRMDVQKLEISVGACGKDPIQKNDTNLTEKFVQGNDIVQLDDGRKNDVLKSKYSKCRSSQGSSGDRDTQSIYKEEGAYHIDKDLESLLASEIKESARSKGVHDFKKIFIKSSTKINDTGKKSVKPITKSEKRPASLVSKDNYRFPTDEDLQMLRNRPQRKKKQQKTTYSENFKQNLASTLSAPNIDELCFASRTACKQIEKCHDVTGTTVSQKADPVSSPKKQCSTFRVKKEISVNNRINRIQNKRSPDDTVLNSEPNQYIQVTPKKILHSAPKATHPFDGKTVEEFAQGAKIKHQGKALHPLLNKESHLHIDLYSKLSSTKKDGFDPKRFCQILISDIIKRTDPQETDSSNLGSVLAKGKEVKTIEINSFDINTGPSTSKTQAQLPADLNSLDDMLQAPSQTHVNSRQHPAMGETLDVACDLEKGSSLKNQLQHETHGTPVYLKTTIRNRHRSKIYVKSLHGETRADEMDTYETYCPKPSNECGSLPVEDLLAVGGNLSQEAENDPGDLSKIPACGVETSYNQISPMSSDVDLSWADSTFGSQSVTWTNEPQVVRNNDDTKADTAMASLCQDTAADMSQIRNSIAVTEENSDCNVSCPSRASAQDPMSLSSYIGSDLRVFLLKNNENNASYTNAGSDTRAGDMDNSTEYTISTAEIDVLISDEKASNFGYVDKANSACDDESKPLRPLDTHTLEHVGEIPLEGNSVDSISSLQLANLHAAGCANSNHVNNMDIDISCALSCTANQVPFANTVDGSEEHDMDTTGRNPKESCIDKNNKTFSTLLDWSRKYDQATKSKDALSYHCKVYTAYRQCCSEIDTTELRFWDCLNDKQVGHSGKMRSLGMTADQTEAHSSETSHAMTAPVATNFYDGDGFLHDMDHELGGQGGVDLDWYKPQSRPLASTSAHDVMMPTSFQLSGSPDLASQYSHVSTRNAFQSQSAPEEQPPLLPSGQERDCADLPSSICIASSRSMSRPGRRLEHADAQHTNSSSLEVSNRDRNTKTVSGLIQLFDKMFTN